MDMLSGRSPGRQEKVKGRTHTRYTVGTVNICVRAETIPPTCNSMSELCNLVKLRVHTRPTRHGRTSSQAPEKTQKGRPVHDQKQVGEIVRGSIRGRPDLIEPPLRHHKKKRKKKRG